MFFFEILRQPDHTSVTTDEGAFALKASGSAWTAGDVEVEYKVDHDFADVTLTSPHAAVRQVRMRWRGSLSPRVRVLGDHWERGYGDLEWRGIVPERPLPWYFLTTNGQLTHGYGVRTGGASFAYWQVDTQGVTLTLDVRCGAQGVRLGERRLVAARVRSRAGEVGEAAFTAAGALCRLLCDSPRLPDHMVYGGNDWYYAYGQNTHAGILADADRIASLAPSSANRPYMVVDGGWSPNDSNAGPWDIGNARFPDMAGLAAGIAARGVRPGIWFRPLTTTPETSPSLLLPHRSFGWPQVLDPTIPEALSAIADNVRLFKRWGYGLVKHDFSTFDIFGKWGPKMGTELTTGGWRFANPSVTTAEAIRALYEAITDAAGDSVIIGCNTVGHLGAGLFDLQRTGDDTSGKAWERTRRMGVNSLAFRMPQHGAFFLADADCVGLTNAIPWNLNKQWLDLLAKSGTPLFVSISPDALGPEQEAALKAAFRIAAAPQPVAEPLDWLDTTCPNFWSIGEETQEYRWCEPDGVSAAMTY